MQDALGTWVIRGSPITVTAGTKKIAVQYACSSTNTAEVLYFNVSQNASTTSAMEQLQLTRLSAGATVTAGTVGGSSGTIFDYSGGAGTFRGTLSTSATGTNGTTSGTQTDTVVQMSFNTLSGYEFVPQPAMRIWVPVSGIIAIEMQAIVSGTWSVGMVVRESR